MCHLIDMEKKQPQRFRSTASCPDPLLGFPSTQCSPTAAEPSLPSSRGWGCTPAIKARTSRPLLKRCVGVCLLVCKCKHACGMSVHPAAWAHREIVSSAVVSSCRQRLFVSQTQSWGAVTWLYKHPTWQGIVRVSPRWAGVAVALGEEGLGWEGE